METTQVSYSIRIEENENEKHVRKIATTLLRKYLNEEEMVNITIGTDVATGNIICLIPFASCPFLTIGEMGEIIVNAKLTWPDAGFEILEMPVFFDSESYCTVIFSLKKID